MGLSDFLANNKEMSIFTAPIIYIGHHIRQLHLKLKSYIGVYSKIINCKHKFPIILELYSTWKSKRAFYHGLIQSQKWGVEQKIPASTSTRKKFDEKEEQID